MKVVVNARGMSVPVGGVRKCMEHLLPLLPKCDPASEYIFVHNRKERAFNDEAVNEYSGGPYSLFFWENVWLPTFVERVKPDVFYSPKNLLPWRLSRAIHPIITVNDLLYYPVRGRYIREYPWQHVWYTRCMLPGSVRRSRAIHAISETTREDLVQRFPSAADKTRVIPLGTCDPVETPDESVVEQMKMRYGLPARYIFFAGTLTARKNVARLLEAFARMADDHPHHIVVTGHASSRGGAVDHLVRRLGLAERFHHLGVVTEADLDVLYRGADIFFYASLYEGFGLPILEAMVRDCPVLTSNTGAMKETSGGAALVVDPYSVDDIERGLRSLLAYPDLCHRLRIKGRERSAHFTWRRCAEALVDVFRQVAE